MREIKFRAWDKRNKKMILTGFHILGETTCCGLIEQCLLENMKEGESLLNRHNDIVFMQYTGQKDETGKEIYEGDVIKFWDIEMQRVRFEEVRFDDGCFCAYGLGDNVFFENTIKVGNKYENPELLKE